MGHDKVNDALDAILSAKVHRVMMMSKMVRDEPTDKYMQCNQLQFPSHCRHHRIFFPTPQTRVTPSAFFLSKKLGL
jgi:hypothetical protein